MIPSSKSWAILLLFSSLAVTSVRAGAAGSDRNFIDPDLREFMLERQREMKGFGSEIKQEYQSFIDENDRDFAVFLKEAWEEYDSQEPVRLIEKPKPEVTPEIPVPAKGQKEPPAPEPLRLVVNTPVPAPAPPTPPPAPEAPPVRVAAPAVPPAVVEPVPPPATEPEPAPPVVVSTPPPVPEAPPVRVAAPVTPPVTGEPVSPPPAQPEPETPVVETTPPTAPAVPPVRVAVPTAPVTPVPPATPPAATAPPVPAVPVAPPASAGTVPVNFDFYGTEIELRCDPRLRQGLVGSIGNETISRYWEAAASGDFKSFLTQARAYRDSQHLNDWGYLLFLDQAGGHLLTAPDRNNRALFAWFMLVKSGYDCKVGFRDDRIILLMPSSGQLFGQYFFTINGKKYYSINPGPQDGDIGKIYTYRGTYPGAVTNLDFALPAYPTLKDDPQSRKLSFNFNGREYTITVEYNRNSIPYFQFYPQNEASIYADAQVPTWVEGSLLGQLKPLVSGLDEAEAVNLLLRFTQTAFSYKTDADQFHREKFLFPEETLYYPYSDCEDRAIMFSYLVRHLLHLDVILLSYPNHIATAVRLSRETPGDQVVVNGVPYTICDPTYINADLGQAMPQFRTVLPKVITL